MSNIGLNKVFPIYNEDGTSFYNLVLHKTTLDSVVMSLGDKITGDVYYGSNTLPITMSEYVLVDGVKYRLVNPPTIVKEGMVSDNSDLRGMTKYSFEFYHPMYLLGNFTFSDIAIDVDEVRYLPQNRSFSWMGTLTDFVAKLNANLVDTDWIVTLNATREEEIKKASKKSDVLTFQNQFISDALKTAYETWDIPFVVSQIGTEESEYAQGKRFRITFGLPSQEIYVVNNGTITDTPFVFHYGQGVGLKNNSRNPRNNKIVTRIIGYGSEDNIPYGYPQIRWYGQSGNEFTYGNHAGVYTNVSIGGHTFAKIVSYPIYKGILGGQYVELIKHPFTRTHLMPSVYRESLFNKISIYNENGSVNTNYDPDIVLVDYYDAIGDDYTNNIISNEPSSEIHEFSDIKPMLAIDGEYEIVSATPINADLTPASGWDDTMNDEGEYVQSYFKIKLPILPFDIYACAAITQEMQINMRGGACIGCTFDVQVDWDEYKRNFYREDGTFDSVIHTTDGDGHVRDGSKYPNSALQQVEVIVQKDLNTFGTLMPSMYQQPQSGDEFVILGISLPSEYISNAEERLDAEMESYMKENNTYYFDYPLKFDEYFLATHVDILSQLSNNKIVRFNYANDELMLYVKQITIKYGEDVLPKYDITLTDNVDVVLNKIGQAIDDIRRLKQNQGDNTKGGNCNCANEFLSKKKADKASGLITFGAGLVSDNDVEVNGRTSTDRLNVANNSVFDGNVNTRGTLDADGDTILSGALETIHNDIPSEAVARLITKMLLGNYTGNESWEGALPDGKGGMIDKDGRADIESLLVRSLTKISDGIFRELVSANPDVHNRITDGFRDGFGGSGMKLWHDTENGKGWCMTLDTLTVRQSMYVFELVIQKIRAVGGILLVSAADGKISTVKKVHCLINSSYEDYYLITFEDTNMFVKHDLMRCQRWNGNHYNAYESEDPEYYVPDEGQEQQYDPNSSTTYTAMKYYWVEVDYTMNDDDKPSTILSDDDVVQTLDDKSILVSCDQFVDTVIDDGVEIEIPSSQPASGDECVLMGNTDSVNHKDRQNYIMISSAEDGVPRIDIITGCHEVGNAGDLRTRLGCLDGIDDPYWRSTVQPNGYGLYSDNAWLKGKFIVKIGNQEKDVGTQFEILDGIVRSTVEATRQEMIGEMGHIQNNLFADGYDYWFMYVGGEIFVIRQDANLVSSDDYLLADIDGYLLQDTNALLVSAGGTEYAKLVDDDTIKQKVCEIKATTIARGLYQRVEDFRNLPDFDVDEQTGNPVPRSFMVSLYYYAITNSSVTIGLGATSQTKNLAATTDGKYHKLVMSFTWDGTTGITITGTGNFRFYGSVLTEDVDATLLDQFVTQITQTAQSIEQKATANVDGVPMLFSDWIQTYNGFKQDVYNRFTNAYSTISQTADNITMAVSERIADNGNKYLSNASFYGWDKWTRYGTEDQYNYISQVVSNGITQLHISARDHMMYITQANADFKDKPSLGTGASAMTTYPVYLEFWMEVVQDSVLDVRLGSVSFLSNAQVTAYSGFQRCRYTGNWDTQGDFTFRVYSGFVRIYGLVLNANTDAATRSMISITSNQIMLEVTGMGSTVITLQDRVGTLSSTVENHTAQISTKVTSDDVRGLISEAEIVADQIKLEGYTSINDGFRVDEQGNATMNNATIVGVLNNLIQEKEFKDGDLRWDFNPLKYGSVIEWTPNPEHAHDTHSLYLPCAYTTDGTMIIDSSAGLTMRDLRQCVGKKYTFLCKTNDVSANMRVIGAVLIQREDYIGASTLDLSSMALGTQVTPEHKYTRREWIGVANYGGITGNYYFTAECKMGRYSGYECIYWEVYCSAQRGEVTYKVSGTAKVNNTPLKHMEVVFGRLISASSEGQQYKTRTDNEGKYAIYLQGSELGVEYTMKVYTSDSALTPSTGTVTNENGTAYGSNATFSNIIPVEQQDIKANINITT